MRARTIRLDTGRMSPEIVERGPLTDIFAIYGAIARRLVPNTPVTGEQMRQGYPPLPAFEQYVKGLLAEAPETKTMFLTQALTSFPACSARAIALWDVHTEAGEHQEALPSYGRCRRSLRCRARRGFSPASRC